MDKKQTRVTLVEEWDRHQGVFHAYLIYPDGSRVTVTMDEITRWMEAGSTEIRRE